MHRRPSGTQRTWLAGSPRKLIRPCPRCEATPGRPCTRTLGNGVVETLKDTHIERKPPRRRRDA